MAKRRFSRTIEQLEPRMLFAGFGDDYGDTFYGAARLGLSSGGAASVRGCIERSYDSDMFRVTATASGRMTIREVAAAPGVDPYLYVYNGSGVLVASNDDSGGTTNSQVVVNITAGTTFYVRAAAWGTTVGRYTLNLATAGGDDYGNTPNSATPLTLSSAGAASVSGVIESQGDVDVFRFTAARTGQVIINQSAAVGSSLDTYVGAANSSGTMIGEDDDSGDGTNSQLTINVTAGQTYYVLASAYGTSTGAYVVQVVGAGGSGGGGNDPAPGGFQITLSLSGLSTSQANLARRAAARWQQVIVGDLPDITFQGTRIDDIAIQIGGQYIDGAGNILGQGGPTGYRSDTLIPCAGRIILDTADMSQLESQGELLDVFTHEIAHVLGFGIFWQQKGLLTGANGTNPQFTGRRALAEYNALFHTNVAGVPVEANGGQGTALSHWRDTVFNTELMTGWNKRGASPLSRVTIASMADLGYVVNMAAADAYTANARSIRAPAAASRAFITRSLAAKPRAASMAASMAAAPVSGRMAAAVDQLLSAAVAGATDRSDSPAAVREQGATVGRLDRGLVAFGQASDNAWLRSVATAHHKSPHDLAVMSLGLSSGVGHAV